MLNGLRSNANCSDLRRRLVMWTVYEKVTYVFIYQSAFAFGTFSSAVSVQRKKKKTNVFVYAVPSLNRSIRVSDILSNASVIFNSINGSMWYKSHLFVLWSNQAVLLILKVVFFIILRNSLFSKYWLPRCVDLLCVLWTALEGQLQIFFAQLMPSG